MLTSNDLLEIPLFAAMDEEERAAVAQELDEAIFDVGQVALREGEPCARCYVIEQGRIELSLRDGDGAKIVVEVLGPGDIFGELPLLDGGTSLETATALEPTRTMSLDRDDLLDLLRRRPSIAEDIIVSLARRLRATDGLLRQRVSRNPNEAIAEQLTTGQRIADTIARVGGSWPFIFAFAGMISVWLVLNTVLLSSRAFDPYPFILLNLVLSMLASVQAPLIMMSQNRQAANDRIRSELDYQVNLKAELEVSQLVRKVDALGEAMEELRQRRG